MRQPFVRCQQVDSAREGQQDKAGQNCRPRPESVGNPPGERAHQKHRNCPQGDEKCSLCSIDVKLILSRGKNRYDESISEKVDGKRSNQGTKCNLVLRLYRSLHSSSSRAGRASKTSPVKARASSICVRSVMSETAPGRLSKLSKS